MRRVYQVMLVMLLCVARFVAAAEPSPIADAAQQGNKTLVRTLIQQKANLNSSQADGMTGLHWAAMNDDVAIAQMLIDAKADLNPVTRLGSYTPLYLAAQNGNASVADVLLRAGADLNRTTATGVTALMSAAASGSTRIIEALIAKEADVNARESARGQTALMFAAASNRGDVIRLLLKHGANVEAVSKAADPGCGSTFTRSGCGDDGDNKSLYEKPTEGRLNELIEPAAAEAVKAEKPKEAAAAKEDEGSVSPEEAAIKTRIAELRSAVNKLASVIDQLEKKTSDQTRRRGATIMGGNTALLLASRDGSMDAVRALVEGGADINKVGTGEKMSPLVIAIVNGHFDLAKYFLEKNADPNLANIQGLTALYAVIDMQWAPYAWRPQPIASQEQTSHIDLVKTLLEHGANPNVRLTKRVWFRSLPNDSTWVDPVGATPFWRAAQAIDLPAMRLLVKAGADPKLPTFEGVTPLMVAAGLGWAPNFSRNAPDAWMEAVKYCLELGIDVNAKSQKGYTALHGTAFLGFNDLVNLLVEKGADPKVVAKDKNTVVDMANGPFPHSIVHPETIALLEKLGATNSNNCRADTCLIVTKKK